MSRLFYAGEKSDRLAQDRQDSALTKEIKTNFYADYKSDVISSARGFKGLLMKAVKHYNRALAPASPKGIMVICGMVCGLFAPIAIPVLTCIVAPIFGAVFVAGAYAFGVGGAIAYGYLGAVGLGNAIVETETNKALNRDLSNGTLFDRYIKQTAPERHQKLDSTIDALQNEKSAVSEKTARVLRLSDAYKAGKDRDLKPPKPPANAIRYKR